MANLDAVNATFAPWPCLARQLLSPKPERFSACASDELPAPRDLRALGATHGPRIAKGADCATAAGWDAATAAACATARRVAGPGARASVCVVS